MSIHPTVDPNDPRLTETQPDYSAVHFRDDGTPFLTDRYLNLSPAMQRYVLALAQCGSEGLAIAARVAGCCRAAHVSKRCKNGKFAVAHKHHCGDHFCSSDSSANYKFNKWAARRDHSVFLLPHEGIEVKLRHPKLRTQMKTMCKLRAAATRLIPALTLNSVSAEAFAELTKNYAIRIVFPGRGSYSYTQIQKILSQLNLDDFLVVTTKRGTTEELFHWAFSGFHDCAAMDAAAKAELRVMLINHHCIASTGDLYRALSKEELAKTADIVPSLCPICKDHDLEDVLPEEQHAESVEGIEAAYEYVDWSREHLSPFLIRKGVPTDIFSPIEVAVPMMNGSTNSPPS